MASLSWYILQIVVLDTKILLLAMRCQEHFLHQSCWSFTGLCILSWLCCVLHPQLLFITIVSPCHVLRKITTKMFRCGRPGQHHLVCIFALGPKGLGILYLTDMGGTRKTGQETFGECSPISRTMGGIWIPRNQGPPVTNSWSYSISNSLNGLWDYSV